MKPNMYKAKMRQIKDVCFMIYAIMTLAVFSACDEDSHTHEDNGGVIIDIDCPEVTVETAHLYIYNADGDFVSTYDYSDIRDINSYIHSLYTGSYTLVVIANAEAESRASVPDKTEYATLTALREWLEAASSDNPNLLSGITNVDVTDSGITPVTISIDQGVFSLPMLSLLFALPEATMPDFTPQQAKSRAAEAGYALRCVAEIYKAGTDKVVLHKAIIPELQSDGTYNISQQLSEGSYDIYLWVDYARLDAPLIDAFYHTESLKAVTIVTEPYTANTDAKDAAYGSEGGVMMSGEGAMVTVALQRPFAKYRIIVDADEIEKYLKLQKNDSLKLPPLDELTVSVQYEGYFPSGFNVSTGMPNNAVGGIAYKGSQIRYDGSAKESELGSDWILVNGESSFVNATVIVSDSKGNKVCRISSTRIDYRRNYLTTISGRFLTSGANSGGVNINTEWSGSFDVWF